MTSNNVPSLTHPFMLTEWRELKLCSDERAQPLTIAPHIFSKLSFLETLLLIYRVGWRAWRICFTRNALLFKIGVRARMQLPTRFNLICYKAVFLMCTHKSKLLPSIHPQTLI